MLKPTERQNTILALPPTSGPRAIEPFEIDRLVAVLRRQIKLILLMCCIGVALGTAFILTAVPQYTASAVLLMDNRRVRAVQDSYEVTAQGIEPTASAVDSQVELLRSAKIALAVVDKLQLLRDPEFRSVQRGPFMTVVSWATGSDILKDMEQVSGPDLEQLRQNAVYRLLSNLTIRRVARTLVLEVYYRSPDPEKAARIANAVTEAYLVDQLEAKYDATRRASVWLQDRMAELKQQVLTSDHAIQKFKAEKDLISSRGTLVNEQQLGEVNTQLVTARAETAKADARYQRIKAIIDTRQTDAVVTEAIGNNIIEQLRGRYVTAAKREAELSARLGPEHGTVVALRGEMREYERLMFDELSRIAESYRSELDIARSKELSLRASLDNLVVVAVSANETLVVLRELERESETFKTLYQSFLQRYQESVQQQSFPITEARVITSATKPGGPSHPRKSLSLVVSLLLGGLAGVCLAGFRELRDNVFRTGAQVREELDLEFLGMLPYLRPSRSTRKDARPSAQPVAGPKRGAIIQTSDIMRHALDDPLSAFAETLRSVKIASDLTLLEQRPRIIGVVSTLPGEGKSTIAKNFASLLAHLKIRTVLIDADLRNPGLTRAVAATAQEGIVEVVLEGKPVAELLLYETDTNLAILPAVLRHRVPHASEFLASPGMKAVIHQLTQKFDVILIDLPPLGPVVDARAIASQLDAFLLVVEWGKTSRKLVRATLSTDQQIHRKCLGVVLNKVKMADLRFYETSGADGYYAKYASYYSGKSVA